MIDPQYGALMVAVGFYVTVEWQIVPGGCIPLSGTCRELLVDVGDLGADVALSRRKWRSARSIRRRPFVVKRDRHHDHRASRDRCRADHRPFFEDGDDDCPPVILCLVREAPACHTHSESPFGPQQVVRF